MANHVKDKLGERIGKLVVLGQAGRTPQGKVRWLCHCDCGNDTIVDSVDLAPGRTTSCGCNRKHAPGVSSLKIIIDVYKSNAAKRGREFTLTDFQATELMSSNCFYCGAPPSNTKATKRANGAFIHGGIDRVDNTKGYTPENCVPCCKVCNIAKRDMTVDEFLSWARRVVKHNDIRP